MPKRSSANALVSKEESRLYLRNKTIRDKGSHRMHATYISSNVDNAFIENRPREEENGVAMLTQTIGAAFSCEGFLSGHPCEGYPLQFAGRASK